MTRQYDGECWYDLRESTLAALRRSGLFSPSVQFDGKIKRLGDGLHHRNYVFWLKEAQPAAFPTDRGFVLRKMSRDDRKSTPSHGESRHYREAAMLQALKSQGLGFATPTFVCFVGDSPETPEGLVETGVPGISLAEVVKFEERSMFVQQSVAKVAAAVHRLPPEGFDFLSKAADCRTDVLSRLAELHPGFVAADPVAADAVQWIHEHLPENRSATVLHGDLLPQNILWDLDSGMLGVVDWEFARIGDPAYDLSIITRGDRRPHRWANGLRGLLDAYRAAGGAGIKLSDVFVHELLLVLKWLEDATRDERAHRREGQPPEFYRDKLRSTLRRAGDV